MTPREQETLEVLAGTRAKGANRRRQAVRIEDLDAILALPAQLQSSTVTAAPTMEQHNALVRDVQSVHAALERLSRHLTTKIT